MIIDTSARFTGQRARKTRPIRAILVTTAISLRELIPKLLLDTLEAKEPIAPGNFFCIGEAGDVWQQTPKALLKKYDVTGIEDSTGALICTPKPDNEVECFEFVDALDTAYIVGLWGETVNGVANLQRVKSGDFVCRQPTDHNDVWVVNRQLFLNTYAFI